LIGRETGWAESWLDKVLGPDFHQHLTVTLTEQSIQGLEIAKDFLLKYQFIDTDFDVNAWVDPLPLERAHDNVRRIA
jgi:ABC-type nitrate/sulfonate/bicarbonate transport system substrate-binding protein